MIQWTKLWSQFLNRLKLFGNWGHLYRIRQSKRLLVKVREIAAQPNSGGRVFSYLRKINPFLFEELVLTIIENSNIRVFRNKRYTGDGGVDGIFQVKTGKVIIQCKRYKSYINPKDVKELANKVKTDKYLLGIFVHTGKTGEMSKDVMRVQDNIVFISGSTLLKFIVGEVHIEKHIQHKIKQ